MQFIFNTQDGFTFTFSFTVVDDFNAYKIGNQIVSQDLVVKLDDNISLAIIDNLGGIVNHNYKYSYTNKSLMTIFTQINNTLIIAKEGKALNHNFEFEKILINGINLSEIIVSM
jgi:hypothetical protein